MNFQCNHGKFCAVDKDNTVAASAKKVTWNCKVDQVATDILIVQITFEKRLQFARKLINSYIPFLIKLKIWKGVHKLIDLGEAYPK